MPESIFDDLSEDDIQVNVGGSPPVAEKPQEEESQEEEKPQEEATQEESGETTEESASEESSEESPEQEAESEEVESEETEAVESSDESEPSEEEEYSDEEYYSNLSEITGVEISSDEELTNIIKEHSQLKSELEEVKSKDPFESLSPLVRDVAKAEEAGMDINTYLSARTSDFDKIEGENVLWEKFKLDNSDLVSKKPDFAKEKFKRDLNAKYGGNAETLDEDDFEDRAEYLEAKRKMEAEQKYISDSKEYDIEKARQELKDWQSKNVTISEKKEEEPTGLSQEQQQELAQKYTKMVNETMEDVAGIGLDIGDNEFTFELDEDSLGRVKQALDNPIEALRDIFGFDLTSDALPDTQKLAKALTLHEVFESEKLGDTLKTWVIEKFNKDTVERKRENPKPKTESIGSAPESPDFWDEVANKFEAQRK